MLIAIIAMSGCLLQQLVANCNEWLLIAMSGCEDHIHIKNSREANHD